MVVESSGTPVAQPAAPPPAAPKGKKKSTTDAFRFIVVIGDKSKRNRFDVICNGEKVTLRDQKQVTDEFLYQFEQEMKRRGS